VLFRTQWMERELAWEAREATSAMERANSDGSGGSTAANILIVDDDRELCETLVAALRRRGIFADCRHSADAALAALDEAPWDAIVTDINMSGMSGLALCERVVANRPDLPVVLITAFGSMEIAVAAIRAGAYDFVTKPFDVDVLALAIQRAVQHRQLREEVKRLREVVEKAPSVDCMIGTSPAILQVFELIERIGDTDASVLINGKSGTGKELVARALHQRGRRADGPFVAVNCAAIPEQLLESELFGHVKGAFTDARSARRGLMHKANGGTLFLDEIAELPLAMQPKILRALQERAVRPVGGDQEEPYDARIITATNRDLEAEVAQGRFREDLYYRINVVRIEVPPLRARGNDVLLIAQHMVARVAAQLGKRVKGLSSPAAAKLLAYGWPGNVRELENCIERAVALATFEQLTVDDLPEKIRNYRSDDLSIPGVQATELLPMEEVERRHLLRVLKAVGGSKSAAAQVLGLDRSTLYRKLEHFSSGSGGGRES
jgi:two-component system, NtrC family, response regulator AtoC